MSQIEELRSEKLKLLQQLAEIEAEFARAKYELNSGQDALAKQTNSLRAEVKSLQEKLEDNETVVKAEEKTKRRLEQELDEQTMELEAIERSVCEAEKKKSGGSTDLKAPGSSNNGGSSGPLKEEKLPFTIGEGADPSSPLWDVVKALHGALEAESNKRKELEVLLEEIKQKVNKKPETGS